MRKKPISELVKAPSYRVLIVMDMIGQHGPISLNDLCALLPYISRAGVWRAAASLRDYGWVRARLADNAFELTSKLDFALSNAHFAHEAVEAARDAIETLLAQGASNVDAGMFTAMGRFEIIESTRSNAPIGMPLSLVEDEFAIAAQRHIDRLELTRHLTTFLKTATTSEAAIITSGVHRKNLEKIEKKPTKKNTVKWLKIANIFLSSK